MINTDKIFRFFDSFFNSKAQFENFKNNFYKGRFGSLPYEVVDVTMDTEEESVILSHYLTEEYDEESGAFIGEDETNKKFYFNDYLKSQLNREANTIYRNIESKFNDFLISKDGLENYKKLVLSKFDTYLEKSEKEPFKKYSCVRITIRSLSEEIKKIFNPFSELETPAKTLRIGEKAILKITIAEFGYLVKILEDSGVFEIKDGNTNKFFEALTPLFVNSKGIDFSAKNLSNEYSTNDISRNEQWYDRIDTIIEKMKKKNNFYRNN